MAFTLVGSVSAEGATQSASITHGLTIASGDLVVAQIHRNAGTLNIAQTAGFEQRVLAVGANTDVYAVQDTIAGASEPASYTFDVGTTQNWSIVLSVFRATGAITFDTINAINNNAAASADIVAQSLTVGANALVFAGFLFDQTDDRFVGGSVDNGFAIADTAGTSAQGVTYRAIPAGGASGDTTFTATGTSTNYGGFQYSYVEAAATPTTPSIEFTASGLGEIASALSVLRATTEYTFEIRENSTGRTNTAIVDTITATTDSNGEVTLTPTTALAVGGAYRVDAIPTAGDPNLGFYWVGTYTGT